MIPMFDLYKEKWQVASDSAIKPGLAAIKAALGKLDNPECSLQVVHVAGTNGKGSTLTFIEGIARAHGLSVGKFMSPCIMDVHDQIQVNNKPITAEQMDHMFRQMQQAGLSGMLTDFELLTCAALLQFKSEQVDLVLLEAGMGGREDSTNVVWPIVSIIPSIALEHTNFLGTTLESIAQHKAGIIKEKRPVVVGRLPQQAQVVIEAEAEALQAPLQTLGADFDVKLKAGGDVYRHLQNGFMIPSLKRQLLGDHQAENMALAITAFFEVARVFKIEVSLEALKTGIYEAQIPGRFEQVYPNVYFDGAHNPASAEALVATIKQQFPKKRVEFVIGMLADKDVTAVLSIFETVADTFYFVDFQNERAMSAERLVGMSKASNKQVLAETTTFFAQPLAEEQTVRIVAGSLYLLSEIRKILISHK